MDQAFGMNNRLDLRLMNPKKFFGLNQFHGLVKHRGTVNGDPLPHGPIGMRLRLRRGGLGEIRLGPIAKGPAAGGNDDALNGRNIFTY